MMINAVFSDEYNDLLYKFYSTSRKFVPTRDAYGLSVSQLSAYVTGLPAGVSATPEAIGFLSTDPRNKCCTPVSPWIDICMYLEAAFEGKESEFMQLYGSNNIIMLKYFNILEILTDLGCLK